jgi:hypothetical protein
VVEDRARGGVLAIAPRVFETGDMPVDDIMVYDRESRDWYEVCDIVDADGRIPGWTQQTVDDACVCIGRIALPTCPVHGEQVRRLADGGGG